MRRARGGHDLARQPQAEESQKLVIRAEFALARVPELKRRVAQMTENRVGRSVYWALTAFCKGSRRPCGRGSPLSTRSGRGQFLVQPRSDSWTSAEACGMRIPRTGPRRARATDSGGVDVAAAGEADRGVLAVRLQRCAKGGEWPVARSPVTPESPGAGRFAARWRVSHCATDGGSRAWCGSSGAPGPSGSAARTRTSTSCELDAVDPCASAWFRR